MGIFNFFNRKSSTNKSESAATGKDFEFLIQGDIDFSYDWDKIMTPRNMLSEKIEKNNWSYYRIGSDEYSYSIEPAGIQMTFNDEITYSKAKLIVDEIVENIKSTGQNASLSVISKSTIYKF